MLAQFPAHERHRIRARAEAFRANNEAFAKWAAGYGVIRHDDLTQVRVHDMVMMLVENGSLQSATEGYARLTAADKVASAAMWMVAHMTYAGRVYTDGRTMEASDFKAEPQGHTGGSLNIAIGYVGYLLANALSGETRSWLMGQGHCVAAIDATNLITDNMSPEQARRYDWTDDGATRFVQDFYSYGVGHDGYPLSPLGSHVNPHTGGGMIEGGYLGFAELLYPHMPLPGEKLVAFLSDGAFEEQRGSDWAARWWRAEDSGLVAPIMIANGRRIDQRSTMAQSGGVDWFRDHLRLNGFDPIDLDGRDPAAFAWAVFEIEARLSACASACKKGTGQYPVPLHYGIAETEKGFGFPGAGTNAAHNLPLVENPHTNDAARAAFNEGAKALFVPKDTLAEAVQLLNQHEVQDRPMERDHPLVSRKLPDTVLPEPTWKNVGDEQTCSPMAGIDEYFCSMVRSNPGLRPRVGNPDEMRSNKLNATLDLLKHRVTAPEEGAAEAVDGAVVTALNEEAVVCAALGNKGGLNLVCSYEAFAVKMLGALRQEIIFARHRRVAGQEPGWLGVPILLTSHTWENGKNEQSHQDPTLCEALLGEMSDVSRVLFPADWNSAQTSLRAVYESKGTIWSLVTPKRQQPNFFTPEQAQQLVAEGAVRLKGQGGPDEKVILVACGAYQLAEALKASGRLDERGIAHGLVYLLEPGRFREPRDEREAAMVAADSIRGELFPDAADIRVMLTHMRAAPFLGTTRPLDTGPGKTFVLGYANRGGTLDENGMLFANGCTWAHTLEKIAKGLQVDPAQFLSEGEIAAIHGKADPEPLWRNSKGDIQ